MNPLHTLIVFLCVLILNLIPAPVTGTPKYFVLFRISRWDSYRFVVSFLCALYADNVEIRKRVFAVTEPPDRLWVSATYREGKPAVEADHSPPSSFEVEMSGTIRPLPYAFMACKETT